MRLGGKRFELILYVLLVTTVMFMGTWLPTAAQTAEKPRYGGTLRVLYVDDPVTLNGILNYWTRTGYISQYVTNKLLRYNEKYEVIPDLATSYTATEGGTVYTFKLRNDVYWHDGAKFTSADVKFHYMKQLNYTTYSTQYMKRAEFKSIDTPDDYTVIFRFGKFCTMGPFVGAMNPTSHRILPKHIFEKGDFENNPANWMMIGNGPFKVQEYEKNKYIILVANDKYFGGRPYLDKIIITFQRDPTAALVALEAGTVDLIHEMPGIPLPELARINKIQGLKAAGYPIPVTWRLNFNFREEGFAKHPWLKDVRVRRAIAHAIDKKSIIDTVMGGVTIPSDGPVSQLIKDFYDDSSVVKYEFNLAKAESLLDEAGYKKGPDGIRFKFVLIGYQSAASQGFFQAVQQQLKRVGIDAEMRPVEDTAFYATYEFGPQATRGMQDYAMALCTMVGGPEVYFNWYSIPPPPGEDYGFFSEYKPEVRQIFDQMQWEPDPKVLAELAKKIQRIVTEEAGFVFLWHVPRSFAYRTEFVGIEDALLPFGNHATRPLTQAWWSKAPMPTTTTATTPRTTTTVAPAPGIDSTTMALVVAVVAIVVIGAVYAMRKKSSQTSKTK